MGNSKLEYKCPKCGKLAPAQPNNIPVYCIGKVGPDDYGGRHAPVRMKENDR